MTFEMASVGSEEISGVAGMGDYFWVDLTTVTFYGFCCLSLLYHYYTIILVKSNSNTIFCSRHHNKHHIYGLVLVKVVIINSRSRSIIIIFALPHSWVQHLLIISIRVIIHPIMNTLSLSQPFLIMLVKFALFYTLVQLNIVSFSQNSQNLVVHLSDAIVGVLN